MTQRIRIYEHGAPSVMRYEADAVGAPGPGQVRLRQDAIGLNFVDTMFRDGTFGVQLPFNMGVEGAGVVEAVGSGVEHVKPGDRAAYFFSFGAYADVRLIAADSLIKLPQDVSNEQAAALVTKGLTAWMLVRKVHAVRPGEFVLVNGAAGGVASLVTRWAKALGATVIAAVGSEAKAAIVRDQGIEHVLLSDDAEFAAKVRALSNGKGVDAAIEFVGKATFAATLAALRDGGHMVHVGNASGAAAVDQAALAARSIRYHQPSTSQYVGDRASLEQAAAELFATMRNGVFGEITATRYALADVAQAHEDMAARRLAGAAILIP